MSFTERPEDEWIEKKEIAAATHIGKLLSVGDEEEEDEKEDAVEGKYAHNKEEKEAKWDALQLYTCAFSQLALHSQKLARKRAWSKFDNNGNGYVSLAELDSCIKSVLHGKYGEHLGTELWRAYRRSSIRAFNDAKDVCGKKHKHGVDRDDYVRHRWAACVL